MLCRITPRRRRSDFITQATILRLRLAGSIPNQQRLQSFTANIYIDPMVIDSVII